MCVLSCLVIDMPCLYNLGGAHASFMFFQSFKYTTHHIFTFGDMSNPMWYLVLTLYMSSQSWYSCGFFCLLWLVDVSVLSNLVYSGSFLPKTTQDHKVSICIKIMSMRSSCLCTYCLQEGLMSMKVFSLIIFCSDAYGQDACNTLPTLSWLCSHMPLYFIFT